MDPYSSTCVVPGSIVQVFGCLLPHVTANRVSRVVCDGAEGLCSMQSFREPGFFPVNVQHVDSSYHKRKERDHETGTLAPKCLSPELTQSLGSHSIADSWLHGSPRYKVVSKCVVTVPRGSKSFGEPPLYLWYGILYALAHTSHQLDKPLFPWYRWGNWDTERLYCKTTKPVNIRGGIMGENDWSSNMTKIKFCKKTKQTLYSISVII